MLIVVELTGSVSAVAPALACLATAAAWTSLRGRRRGWLTHAQVRTMSWHVALGHGLVAFGGVGTAVVLRPAWFEGAVPLATTVGCSVLAAAAGAGLTLCGVNLVNGSWGAFNGRSAS